jgi:hypothetical protein
MPWTKRRSQRNEALAQVRQHKRSLLPGFAYDYGDFEVNKARAKALREAAQKEDG